MLRIFIACILALGAGLCAGDTARAGAWTRSEGDGVVILSLGRQAAPFTALAGALPTQDKYVGQIYVEYGVIEAVTVGASLFADTEFTHDGTGDGSTAAASLFVRTRVYSDDDGYVGAVQLGGAFPLEDKLGDDFSGARHSAPEVRFSVLGGTSWWGDWGSAFASGALGYAWVGRDDPSEIRMELTTGYEPRHCCLAILSLFYAEPLSAAPGESRADGRSLTIAPSFAYRLLPQIARNGKKPEGPLNPATIQIGINYDLLNGGDGIGLQIAIWKKF
ncbi:MAG: hypothetical protein AAF074_13340 [Pseudomonadota bacterium]